MPGQRQQAVSDSGRSERAGLQVLLPQPQVPLQARAGADAAARRRPGAGGRRAPGMGQQLAGWSSAKSRAERGQGGRHCRCASGGSGGSGQTAGQARGQALGQGCWRHAGAVAMDAGHGAHRPGQSGRRQPDAPALEHHGGTHGGCSGHGHGRAYQGSLGAGGQPPELAA